MEIPNSLDRRQRKLLEDLVRIPSPSGGEEAILQYLERRLQQTPSCRITKQRVDDQHWNLIVERGEQSAFTILLYGHVDTVQRCDGWENHYALDDDPGREGILRGVGCSDMKPGIMLMVDLMETPEFPPGMRLICAFCVDEERTSKGAQKLASWNELQEVDLILSPEIATRMKECDCPKDIVIGRRGNVKTAVSICTPGGHGYDESKPSAIAASRQLRNHMMDQFHRARAWHPLFGSDQLDETFEGSPEGDYLDRSTFSSFGLRHMTIPGGDIQSSVQWQLNVARTLAETQNWADQGITYTLGLRTERTSYNPYLTDQDIPVVQQLVVPAAQDVFQKTQFVGGLSPADSNILAQTGKPVVEVGPVGGDAHEGTEWVSEASVAATAFFYRHLLLCRLPSYLKQRQVNSDHHAFQESHHSV